MNDPRSPGQPPTARTPRLRGLGCALLPVLLVIGLIAAGFVWGPRLIQQVTGQSDLPPLPFEDRTSPEHAAEVRAQAVDHLNSAGWIDQDAGIAHIPIEAAMAQLAETGLPVGMQPDSAEADPAPSDEPANTDEDTGDDATEDTEGDSAESPGDEAGQEADEEAASAEIDLSQVTYQEHVLPIFETYCGECHGADDPEEQLELTRYRTTMVGSENGPVIEPGDPANSYLVELVVEGRMPKDADPLPQHEIDIIIAWVEAGAPEQ